MRRYEDRRSTIACFHLADQVAFGQANVDLFPDTDVCRPGEKLAVRHAIDDGVTSSEGRQRAHRIELTGHCGPSTGQSCQLVVQGAVEVRSGLVEAPATVGNATLRALNA